MALIRDLKPRDSLRIGETTITVEHKSGQRTRLRIESPLDVTIPDQTPPAPVTSTLKRPQS